MKKKENSFKPSSHFHKSKFCAFRTFHSPITKLKYEAHKLKKKGFKPMIIEVHRAAGIYEYENTLKAVKKAVEMGCTRIEIDTWLLLKDKDNVPVLHGEDDGFWTLNDKRRDLIVNFTYDELKNKVTLPNGDYIPKLAELLDLAKGKLLVNIELKGEDLNLFDKVFEIVAKKNMFKDVHFSSFFHPFYDRLIVLKKKYQLKENIMFGFLMWKDFEVKSFVEKLPEHFWENKNSINLDLTLLLKYKWIREKMNELRKKGVLLTIYFPFEIKETNQLLKIMTKFGVDKAICNDPIAIQKFNKYYE